jgi:hypothetical protein
MWFATAIVRLERYRYASALGMCDRYAGELQRAKRELCLERTETRTTSIAHLLHGLKLL